MKNPNVVVTRIAVEATPEKLWERLLFYEQIDEPPPFHLRLLLPVPIETVGKKTEVGDEARCLYRGGHLIKRVTGLEPPNRYAFEVIEQELDVGGGMRLSGGEYVLRPLAPGRTELEVTTRYVSPKAPRWFWEPIEQMVCHSFHRHILNAMRREAEAA